MAKSQITFAETKLFILTIMTSFGVWVAGNFLLKNTDIFISSAFGWGIMVSILASIYLIYRQSGSFPLALISVSLIILFGVRLGMPHIGYIFLLAIPISAYTLLLDMKGSEWAKLLFFSLFGIVCILYARSMLSFDMDQRMHIGNVHRDTLFHASIAAMLKNYSIISSGINGLVGVDYHVFSHVVIAETSFLSNVPILQTYAFAVFFLFLPLLFWVLVQAVPEFKEKNIEFLWVVVCGSVFFTPFILKGFKVWSSYFVSESYLLSIILLLAALPLLTKAKLNRLDSITLVIAGLLMSHSKSSVGLIFVGLVVTRYIFICQDKKRELPYLGLLLLGTYFTLIHTARSLLSSGEKIAFSTEKLNFEPFHFLYRYYDKRIPSYLKEDDILSMATSYLWVVYIVILFVIFHFFFSAMVVAYHYFKGGIKNVFFEPQSVLSLAAWGAGLMAVLLLKLAGGAVYYFSNVAMFVSLPFFIGLVYTAIYPCMNPVLHDRRIYFLLPLFFVFFTWSASEYSRKKKTLWNYSQRFKVIRKRGGIKPNPLVTSLNKLRNTVPKTVILKPGPKFNTNAIRLFPGKVKCRARPFVLTAVSERSWINAIPSDKSCKYRYTNYGFKNYRVKKADGTYGYTKSYVPPNVKILSVNRRGNLIKSPAR